jgi:serine/threonine-protein phosphatase PGAM5
MRIIEKFLAFALMAGPLVAADTAAPADAPAPRYIYLVRHGAYLSDSKVDPDVGPGLSTLGIAQARLVAARLRGLPFHFDSMVSSTMARAEETAAVIHETLPEVPFTRSALLCEASLPMRGRSDDMQVKREAATAAVERVDQVFADYFVPSKGAPQHILLVCHGNVIRYLVVKALGVDPLSWIGFTVGNASITIVKVSPSGHFNVLAVGDMGHIPPDLQSGLTAGPEPLLVVPQ